MSHLTISLQLEILARDVVSLVKACLAPGQLGKIDVDECMLTGAHHCSPVPQLHRLQQRAADESGRDGRPS